MATRKKGSHWVRWAWESWAPQGAMALAVACDALYPLEGSRRGAVEDVGGPWGLFQAPESWGTNPSIPLGPARDGGQWGRQRAE